ncbi:MAG: PorT family protein [Sphingobacteriales bacterium]|nr:MAG: PorT family protein [Sphingobacteriales bacterium]
MKKLIVCLACFASLAFTSNAQTKISPIVGVNLANLGGDVEDADGKTGAHLGVLFNFGLGESISVQPGILYSMKGAEDLSLNYIEVPINLVYKLPMGLMFHAGPYLGYAISGKMDFGGVEVDDIFEEGGFKRLDYGFNLGAGYQLPMGLFFRAQYGLGLANIGDKFLGLDDYKISNRVIGISVGYTLGGRD